MNSEFLDACSKDILKDVSVTDHLSNLADRDVFTAYSQTILLPVPDSQVVAVSVQLRSIVRKIQNSLRQISNVQKMITDFGEPEDLISSVFSLTSPTTESPPAKPTSLLTFCRVLVHLMLSPTYGKDLVSVASRLLVLILVSLSQDDQNPIKFQLRPACKDLFTTILRIVSARLLGRDTETALVNSGVTIPPVFSLMQPLTLTTFLAAFFQDSCLPFAVHASVSGTITEQFSVPADSLFTSFVIPPLLSVLCSSHSFSTILFTAQSFIDLLQMIPNLPSIILRSSRVGSSPDRIISLSTSQSPPTSPVSRSPSPPPQKQPDYIDLIPLDQIKQNCFSLLDSPHTQVSDRGKLLLHAVFGIEKGRNSHSSFLESLSQFSFSLFDLPNDRRSRFAGIEILLDACNAWHVNKFYVDYLIKKKLPRSLLRIGASPFISSEEAQITDLQVLPPTKHHQNPYLIVDARLDPSFFIQLLTIFIQSDTDNRPVVINLCMRYLSSLAVSVNEVVEPLLALFALPFSSSGLTHQNRDYIFRVWLCVPLFSVLYKSKAPHIHSTFLNTLFVNDPLSFITLSIILFTHACLSEDFVSFYVLSSAVLYFLFTPTPSVLPYASLSPTHLFMLTTLFSAARSSAVFPLVEDVERMNAEWHKRYSNKDQPYNPSCHFKCGSHPNFTFHSIDVSFERESARVILRHCTECLDYEREDDESEETDDGEGKMEEVNVREASTPVSLTLHPLVALLSSSSSPSSCANTTVPLFALLSLQPSLFLSLLSRSLLSSSPLLQSCALLFFLSSTRAFSSTIFSSFSTFSSSKTLSPSFATSSPIAAPSILSFLFLSSYFSLSSSSSFLAFSNKPSEDRLRALDAFSSFCMRISRASYALALARDEKRKEERGIWSEIAKDRGVELEYEEGKTLEGLESLPPTHPDVITIDFLIKSFDLSKRTSLMPSLFPSIRSLPLVPSPATSASTSSFVFVFSNRLFHLLLASLVPAHHLPFHTRLFLLQSLRIVCDAFSKESKSTTGKPHNPTLRSQMILFPHAPQLGLDGTKSEKWVVRKNDVKSSQNNSVLASSSFVKTLLSQLLDSFNTNRLLVRDVGEHLIQLALDEEKRMMRREGGESQVGADLVQDGSLSRILSHFLHLPPSFMKWLIELSHSSSTTPSSTSSSSPPLLLLSLFLTSFDKHSLLLCDWVLSFVHVLLLDLRLRMEGVTRQEVEERGRQPADQRCITTERDYLLDFAFRHLSEKEGRIPQESKQKMESLMKESPQSEMRDYSTFPQPHPLGAFPSLHFNPTYHTFTPFHPFVSLLNFPSLSLMSESLSETLPLPSLSFMTSSPLTLHQTCALLLTLLSSLPQLLSSLSFSSFLLRFPFIHTLACCLHVACLPLVADTNSSGDMSRLTASAIPLSYLFPSPCVSLVTGNVSPTLSPSPFASTPLLTSTKRVAGWGFVKEACGVLTACAEKWIEFESLREKSLWMVDEEERKSKGEHKEPDMKNSCTILPTPFSPLADSFLSTSTPPDLPLSFFPSSLKPRITSSAPPAGHGTYPLAAGMRNERALVVMSGRQRKGKKDAPQIERNEFDVLMEGNTQTNADAREFASAQTTRPVVCLSSLIPSSSIVMSVGWTLHVILATILSTRQIGVINKVSLSLFKLGKRVMEFEGRDGVKEEEGEKKQPATQTDRTVLSSVNVAASFRVMFATTLSHLLHAAFPSVPPTVSPFSSFAAFLPLISPLRRSSGATFVFSTLIRCEGVRGRSVFGERVLRQCLAVIEDAKSKVEKGEFEDEDGSDASDQTSQSPLPVQPNLPSMLTHNTPHAELIHSFNILAFLIRDSFSNALTLAHLPSALVSSLFFLSAVPNWEVQNAAAYCFAQTFSRLLGAKKAKENERWNEDNDEEVFSDLFTTNVKALQSSPSALQNLTPIFIQSLLVPSHSHEPEYETKSAVMFLTQNCRSFSSFLLDFILPPFTRQSALSEALRKADDGSEFNSDVLFSALAGSINHLHSIPAQFQSPSSLSILSASLILLSHLTPDIPPTSSESSSLSLLTSLILSVSLTCVSLTDTTMRQLAGLAVARLCPPPRSSNTCQTPDNADIFWKLCFTLVETIPTKAAFSEPHHLNTIHGVLHQLSSLVTTHAAALHPLLFVENSLLHKFLSLLEDKFYIFNPFSVSPPIAHTALTMLSSLFPLSLLPAVFAQSITPFAKNGAVPATKSLILLPSAPLINELYAYCADYLQFTRDPSSLSGSCVSVTSSTPLLPLSLSVLFPLTFRLCTLQTVIDSTRQEPTELLSKRDSLVLTALSHPSLFSTTNFTSHADSAVCETTQSLLLEVSALFDLVGEKCGPNWRSQSSDGWSFSSIATTLADGLVQNSALLTASMQLINNSSTHLRLTQHSLLSLLANLLASLADNQTLTRFVCEQIGTKDDEERKMSPIFSKLTTLCITTPLQQDQPASINSLTPPTRTPFATHTRLITDEQDSTEFSKLHVSTETSASLIRLFGKIVDSALSQNITTTSLSPHILATLLSSFCDTVSAHLSPSSGSSTILKEASLAALSVSNVFTTHFDTLMMMSSDEEFESPEQETASPRISAILPRLCVILSVCLSCGEDSIISASATLASSFITTHPHSDTTPIAQTSLEHPATEDFLGDEEEGEGIGGDGVKSENQSTVSPVPTVTPSTLPTLQSTFLPSPPLLLQQLLSLSSSLFSDGVKKEEWMKGLVWLILSDCDGLRLKRKQGMDDGNEDGGENDENEEDDKDGEGDDDSEEGTSRDTNSFSRLSLHAIQTLSSILSPSNRPRKKPLTLTTSRFTLHLPSPNPDERTNTISTSLHTFLSSTADLVAGCVEAEWAAVLKDGWDNAGKPNTFLIADCWVPVIVKLHHFLIALSTVRPLPQSFLAPLFTLLVPTESSPNQTLTSLLLSDLHPALIQSLSSLSCLISGHKQNGEDRKALGDGNGSRLIGDVLNRYLDVSPFDLLNPFWF